MSTVSRPPRAPNARASVTRLDAKFHHEITRKAVLVDSIWPAGRAAM